MTTAPGLLTPELEAQIKMLAPEHAAYVLHRIDWLGTARAEQLPPGPGEQEQWLASLNARWLAAVNASREHDPLAEPYLDWQAAVKGGAKLAGIREEGNDRTVGIKAMTTHPGSPWLEFGVQSGRGFGKTRVGAEWLFEAAWNDPQALPRCLVAPTQNDARFTCFEGESSGLLSVIPAACIENYNRTELVLTLKNGAMIRGFSAEKADRLRGPQHADAWCDELAAWGPDGEDVWDMMEFGLRLGQRPRILWSSTPKPTALFRRLTAPQEGRIIVRGSTKDNRHNLAETFLKKIEVYEGTKLGNQELDGELLDPEEAGIIRRSWLRLWPADKPLPAFQWIIMSLDTAFTEKTIDKKGDPDPSACGVWGIFLHEKRTNIMLLDCWEDHLGLPDLVRKVRKEMNNRYGDDEDDAVIKPMIGASKPLGSGRKPDILLIEDKGSGISLRQSLAEQDIETHAYNPGRADKVSRLHMVSPIFSQKRVWMPESRKIPGKPMTWCEPVISQICSFTGEGSIRHDDHVDQCTQAIRLAIDKQMLQLTRPAEERKDYVPPPPADYSNPYAC